MDSAERALRSPRGPSQFVADDIPPGPHERNPVRNLRAWLARSSRRPPRSILFWLWWLVIGTLVPGWVATTWLIVDLCQRESASQVNSAVGIARALTQTLDRQLAAEVVGLQTLAASPYLAAGDFANFRRQAVAALPIFNARSVSVFDSSGAELMNTLRPSDASPPRIIGSLQTLGVFRSGQPVISDLFRGSVTGQLIIAVAVPVFVNGAVTYGIGIGLYPESLAELLHRAELPTSWTAAIADGAGTFVARTRNPEKFVGKKIAPELLRKLAETSQGVVEGTTLEGIPAVASFRKSSLSNWAVGIAIPTAELTAPLYRSLRFLIIAAIGLFLVALLAAWRISKRIARSIRALNEPALALAGGAPVVVPPPAISEVDEIGNALAKAAGLLNQRRVARDDAERAEHRMAVAKEAADRSNLAKSQFLATMSHELRTPLTGIIGFAQLLQRPFYGPLTAKQKEFLDAIRSCSNQLNELINDVLELSKIDAGRVSASLERVELVPLMRTAVESLQPSAKKAGIAVKAGNFGADMPALRADPVRLMQCLINLGTNAVKYNRPQGSIAFSYGREGDFVRISVVDTGIGIPLNRQSELFEPFNRLGAEQKGIEGTGIGLALTRRLIELMGGRIGFASIPGEGSRFWLDIPVDIVAAEDSCDSGAAAAPDHTLPVSDASILYVEDNPANAALMRDLLATSPNIRLFQAADAASGLALAKEHRPDLIIVDINLPDMDGVALLKRLKALPQFASTPFLALSANAMPRAIERAMAAGFFDYVTKPVDLDRLLAKIGEALAARRSGISS